MIHLHSLRPVPTGIRPPRVGLLLTTYRHERYVAAALDGALAQTWPALDLVVSDDASDDGTWEKICQRAASYRGPHRLILQRQGTNVGPARNLSDAMSRTDADFLVLSHGDDISRPDRVQRMAETWISTGASLIASQARTGPEPREAELLAPESEPSAAVPLEELCRVTWSPRQLGATFGFERRVFTEFGPFDRERLPRGGDHVLPTRGALLGGFHYLSEPLVFWRRHERQMTLQTADFDGCEHSHAETWRAYDLNGLLYRYDEITEFESRNGGSMEISAAKRTLLATIAETTEEWSGHRAKLEAKNQRLEFAARRAAGVTAVERRASA